MNGSCEMEISARKSHRLKGCVLLQSPKAGKVLKRGARVNLKVGTG
jgi:beta-lactam-binding protein with PASTA domain